MEKAGALFSIFLAGTLSLGLAFRAWRRRKNEVDMWLTWLMGAIGLWSLRYAVELTLTELAQMQVSTTVAWVGMATTPVFWFLFAVHHAGLGERWSPGRVALLFVVPLLTVCLVAAGRTMPAGTPLAVLAVLAASAAVRFLVDKFVVVLAGGRGRLCPGRQPKFGASAPFKTVLTST